MEIKEKEYEIDADFCMKIMDDSLINSRIKKGDMLYVKDTNPQKGNIAVVKRVDGTVNIGYWIKEREHGQIILMPDNPDFEPVIIDHNEPIVVLGVVVAFTGVL